MGGPIIRAQHTDDIGGKPTMLCVTITAEDRQHANYAMPEVHDCLRAVWMRDVGWCVNRYMIMPDHLHFFVTPGEKPISLARWMRQWTGDCYYAVMLNPVLLRADFRDSKIYTAEQYHDLWAFIRQNPVRHALVTDADAWPYQGEINPFLWTA